MLLIKYRHRSLKLTRDHGTKCKEFGVRGVLLNLKPTGMEWELFGVKGVLRLERLWLNYHLWACHRQLPTENGINSDKCGVKEHGRTWTKCGDDERGKEMISKGQPHIGITWEACGDRRLLILGTLTARTSSNEHCPSNMVHQRRPQTMQGPLQHSMSYLFRWSQFISNETAFF